METEVEWEELEFDLMQFCETAGVKFGVDAIYLFGSRRFKTDSVRSDIDLFFVISKHIRPSLIRTLIDDHCQALDIFLLLNGTATSVANESYICGEDNDDLLRKSNAVKLWSRKSGLGGEELHSLETNVCQSHQFFQNSPSKCTHSNFNRWIKEKACERRTPYGSCYGRNRK